MQDEKQNFSGFRHRTDALAVSLRCDLTELPDRIGLSRAMLFAYRGEKSPISSKAWRKLERAEREAGIAANRALRNEQRDLANAFPGTMEEKQRFFDVLLEFDDLGKRLQAVSADFDALLGRVKKLAPLDPPDEARAESTPVKKPKMQQQNQGPGGQSQNQ